MEDILLLMPEGWNGRAYRNDLTQNNLLLY